MSTLENFGANMIVDISLSNDGTPVYQFQKDELAPSTSTNTTTNNNKRFLSSETDFAENNKIRKIEDSFTDIESSSFISAPPVFNGSMKNQNEEETEVWGSDVEAAFEEALRIIPKNGLSKIKVSGRSCGRNELISDYIYQQTNKLRTRKQVSSHIQVIKNLKKNNEIIDLINNGPSDPSSLQKFEAVFSKINFRKSVSAGTNSVGSSNASVISSISHNSSNGSCANTSVFINSNNVKNISEVTLKDFEMNVENHKLSALKSKDFESTLKLKGNANINTRFPGLLDLFKNSSTINGKYFHILNHSIPSLHGMCKVLLPEKHVQQSSFNTHVDITMKGLSINESSWSVLTVIYSFGQEVVRLVDNAEVVDSEMINGVKDVSLKIKFANEFWNAFLASSSKINDDKQKDIALRAITIKQIIFKNSTFLQEKKKASSVNILKQDIRTVFLWEFLRAKEDSKAMTTIRKIHLMNPVAAPAVPKQQTISKQLQQQRRYMAAVSSTPRPVSSASLFYDDIVSRTESPIHVIRQLEKLNKNNHVNNQYKFKNFDFNFELSNNSFQNGYMTMNDGHTMNNSGIVLSPIPKNFDYSMVNLVNALEPQAQQPPQMNSSFAGNSDQFNFDFGMMLNNNNMSSLSEQVSFSNNNNVTSCVPVNNGISSGVASLPAGLPLGDLGFLESKNNNGISASPTNVFGSFNNMFNADNILENLIN